MVVILFFMKRIVKIQSISDLITNSSTEAFVVYDKGNVRDIKNLVNSILSLLDPSKTFDDYFTIEMLINYDDLQRIFWRYHDDEKCYEDVPELKGFGEMDNEEAEKFLESLPLERVEEIFEWANDGDGYRRYQLYEGFAVNAKDENDPIARKVAIAINNVDNIFDVDYSSDY